MCQFLFLENLKLRYLVQSNANLPVRSGNIELAIDKPYFSIAYNANRLPISGSRSRKELTIGAHSTLAIATKIRSEIALNHATAFALSSRISKLESGAFPSFRANLVKQVDRCDIRLEAELSRVFDELDLKPTDNLVE